MTKFQFAFLVAFMSFSCSDLHGARVGFSFEGAFTGSSTQMYNLFGIDVPRNALIDGTFSYDTTTQGVDFAPGVRNYHQMIRGGYTLNIYKNDVVAIALEASDYFVTVANDFGSPESDIFSIDYNHDIANSVIPERLTVNGVEWTGPRSFIKFQLSWDPQTFTDPDEPKLTADRPVFPGSSKLAFVGSSSAARLFAITQISSTVPEHGDYNYDGIIGSNDYLEWRKAFGQSDVDFLYADGNLDSIVDAADYVVWRKASIATANTAAVPEPGGSIVGLALAALFTIWARSWQQDGRQR